MVAIHIGKSRIQDPLNILLCPLFIPLPLKDTASIPAGPWGKQAIYSNTATLSYSAFLAMVLEVLLTFFIFCPDIFSVCSEGGGKLSCVGLNGHGRCPFSKSRSLLEGRPQPGQLLRGCPTSCSLVSSCFHAPWPFVAVGKAGFRTVAAKCFALNFESLLCPTMSACSVWQGKGTREGQMVTGSTTMAGESQHPRERSLKGG